ncbi:hypothetical protein ACX3V1_06520 [Escherichia coli]
MLQVVTSYCPDAVSYTHLRAHETSQDLVCRLLLENGGGGPPPPPFSSRRRHTRS